MGSRKRFFDTIKNGNSEEGLPFIPITMMVAADEIGVPYLEYATDYRVHVKGQAGISERFSIDHVSSISDPATEAADLGAEVVYYDDQPPAIQEANALLADKARLKSLRIVKPEDGKRMNNRVELVRRLKEELGHEKIIEGWIEGPTAESSDLRGINNLMMDLMLEPDFVTDLMAFTSEVSLGLAKAQVEAGADVIGVGDAAASLVGPDLYQRIIKPFQRRYIETIHSFGALVRLHICGNIEPILPYMNDLKIDILDIDSMVSVEKARTCLGEKVLLAGNINPVSVLKDGRPDIIKHALSSCYEMAGKNRYAVAAGCEVPRGTPSENIHAMRMFAESI